MTAKGVLRKIFSLTSLRWTFFKVGRFHCLFLLFILMILLSVIIGIITLPVNELYTISVKETDDSKLNDEAGELTVFIQISDTHISQKFYPERGQDFDTFLKTNIPTVKPKFVIHSGDITDGVQYPSVKSGEDEDDWRYYRTTLNNSGFLNSSFWIDMRGNHDTLDILGWNSKTNYFSDHSSYGKSLTADNYTNYDFIYTTPSGQSSYYFVVADLSPEIGLPLPWNVYAHWSKPIINKLEDQLERSKNYNHTLLITHYPRGSATQMSRSDRGRDLYNLVEDYPVTAHLCGHEHMNDYFFRRNKGRFLELELYDWKNNRFYRIFVIDNDITSFSDQLFSDWPVVIITNPKDARFITEREPLGRMLSSTHIRVLVFHTEVISSVEVVIDGKSLGSMSQANSTYPLWTLPWSAKDYSTGKHDITIRVFGTNGQAIKETNQKFSLNGKIQFIGYTFSRLLYQIVPYKFLFAFGVSFLVAAILLMFIFPKTWLYYLEKQGKLTQWSNHMRELEQYEDNMFKKLKEHEKRPGFFIFWEFERSLWRYSRIPWRFWIPLFVVHVLYAVAPAYIGPLVEDKWGAFFYYGLWINGEFVMYYEFNYFAMLFQSVFLWCSTNLVARSTYRDHFLHRIVKKQNKKGKHVKMQHFFLPWFGPRCPHTYIIGYTSSYVLFALLLIGLPIGARLTSDFFRAEVVFLSPWFYLYIVGLIVVFASLIEEVAFLYKTTLKISTKEYEFEKRDKETETDLKEIEVKDSEK